MSELAYTDFRSFVEEAKRISDYRIIEGADWDAEIGALVESTAELVPQPPMLIFDKVKGYPAGYGFAVCPMRHIVASRWRWVCRRTRRNSRPCAWQRAK